MTREPPVGIGLLGKVTVKTALKIALIKLVLRAILVIVTRFVRSVGVATRFVDT